VRDIWSPDGLFFDRLVTTAWWHRQDEAQRREDLRDGGTVYRRREIDDRIDSFGIEPQFTSQVGDHQITYGVLVLFERTDNDYREFRNLGGTDPAGATPWAMEDWPEKTTITDGAEYDTYAVYVQDLWQIAEEWSLLGGLRYTYVDWDFDTADGDADDVTGSLRGSWRFREDMLVFVGASKAFRAPNLNDLDGATDRASSGTINFGNPNLDPEVSYTFEAGWRFVRGRDRLSASVFHTTIEDVIQRVYPEGGGEGMTDNGEGAYLRGLELEWDYGIPIEGWLVGERLALVGSLSWIDTEEEVPQEDGTTVKQPISRANRLFGIAGLRWEIDDNWWVKGQVRFHDAYDDVTPGDAGDVRLTVPGRDDGRVPGFGVIDLSAGWVNDARDRRVTLILENLGDKTYRQLGSGADAPGFNVVLAVEVRF
jgi:outer membrane receptor protein involved in Fe transport